MLNKPSKAARRASEASTSNDNLPSQDSSSTTAESEFTLVESNSMSSDLNQPTFEHLSSQNNPDTAKRYIKNYHGTV